MAVVYNRTKAEGSLLKAHETSPPSLSIDLFTEYWRLNSGPNCLYHTPIATLLEDIRARRVPVDFIQIFHALRIPFYDGSLIVEIHDHRDQPVGERASERVVLWPNDETLYAEICLAASKDPEKWTDLDALMFEANHLLQREPELILEPDPLVSKVVNASLSVSTPLPVSFKRKREAIDTVQEKEEKVQRARTMNLMNPRANKSFVPDFRVIDRISQKRQELMQTQNREGAGSGSSEGKPQLGRLIPNQHPPQPMMARKVDSPAPGPNATMHNDGPSSRRRSNAIQPPPVAIPSIANNLRRKNGAFVPSGKAIDEPSPNESPAPQQPTLPPPATQPPTAPAVVLRTMTPVHKGHPAAGLGKPPESNSVLQQPVQPPSSPAVPAAQAPQQSLLDVQPPRPPSQQATNSGPQSNAPNGVGAQVAARFTQPPQPLGTAQQQNNGTNGAQLNRPLQQPSQYQPSSAHVLQQQQAQSGATDAGVGASTQRATATPTPNLQQVRMQHQAVPAAAAAATTGRHPNNVTPAPHQQLPQSHQPQPAASPVHQQQTSFQGLSGAARFQGHSMSNVSGQAPPNSMQMPPNVVQAAQQQQRLQAMNNSSQNFSHQQQQNGQQTTAFAALMASRAAAAQQSQQQTSQPQRPNVAAPAGSGGGPNPNSAAMAQYLARSQPPQYNPTQLLLHHQQQRAQQVPPGAVAQQQSQQQSQPPPQPQPPQQQQGAPGMPNLQHLSPAQLQNLFQQLMQSRNQPGTTPQQQQQREFQLKALLTQIQTNNAAANVATGPSQGTINASTPVNQVNQSMVPTMAAIAQFVQNNNPQQAARIMQQLQTAQPGLNIPALLQNYHQNQIQRQQQQQVQGQAPPQNLQSNQSLPGQAQTTHPLTGASPLPNSAFALGPLPPNYTPNWRGRGGPPGNMQQGQQPAGPGGLGRGGR